MFPVCDESTDHIIGVLNTKDYFRITDKTRDNITEIALKPPYFVPETVCADVLFRNMKLSRNHFAIILDEYGGMNGIITMNDLLEELVGDLEDDNTIPKDLPQIEQIDSHTWRIQGSVPLEMVSEQLGVMLPEDNFDTFGGLVFGLLGFIPEDGSTPTLEIFGLIIRVVMIKDHYLESAIVCFDQTAKIESNKKE